MSQEEDRQLFHELDAEGSGSLDFPEFLAFVARKMRDAVRSEAELHDAFRYGFRVQQSAPSISCSYVDAPKNRVFDRDGTGFLKRDEFRQMMDYNGFSGTGEGADLLERANRVFDERSVMDFDCFMKLITNKEGGGGGGAGPNFEAMWSRQVAAGTGRTASAAARRFAEHQQSKKF